MTTKVLPIVLKKAVARTAFVGDNETQISFSPGQIINIVSFSSTGTDFWKGYVAGTEHIGYFPANHVEIKEFPDKVQVTTSFSTSTIIPELTRKGSMMLRKFSRPKIDDNSENVKVNQSDNIKQLTDPKILKCATFIAQFGRYGQNSTWKHLYFILTESTLDIYKTSKDKDPLIIFDLPFTILEKQIDINFCLALHLEPSYIPSHSATEEKEDQRKRSYSLSTLGKKEESFKEPKVIYDCVRYCAATEDEFNEWYAVTTETIKKSKEAAREYYSLNIEEISRRLEKFLNERPTSENLLEKHFMSEEDLITRGILNSNPNPNPNANPNSNSNSNGGTHIKSIRRATIKKLTGLLNNRPAKHALERKNILQAFNPVFGVSLEELYQKTGRTIPFIAEKCCEYLREYALDSEGIFRISGNARVIQTLKLMFNQVDFVDLTIVCKNDVHTVAGLFKLFLRELPNPLFTFDKYTQFVSIFKPRSNQKEKDRQASLLMADLPDAHLYFLKFLVDFLQEIIAHSAVNKMNSNNLARIFGPVLLAASHSENEGDVQIVMLGESPIQIEMFQRILDTNLFGALNLS